MICQVMLIKQDVALVTTTKHAFLTMIAVHLSVDLLVTIRTFHQLRLADPLVLFIT